MQPRADLHRHLDGSLRPATLRELAARFHVELPPDIRFHAGMGLAAALSRFTTTLATLQHPAEVRRVAAEICEDAASDGVTTLEIRFAPQLHQGASLEDITAAAVEGAAGRAGIVLCALYGEPPALVESLVRVAIANRGVVGIDLAGGPAPGHGFGAKDYMRAFSMARDAGLGRTVHAGEGRPPDEIRFAIEHLHAQRIGHGTTVLDDTRVADLVMERGVTIEACPTSNVHTNVISDVKAHPLARWLERGLKACINTDNTLLSDVTSLEEHRRSLGIDGMTPELLARAIAHGHAAAFPRRA